MLRLAIVETTKELSEALRRRTLAPTSGSWTVASYTSPLTSILLSAYDRENCNKKTTEIIMRKKGNLLITIGTDLEIVVKGVPLIFTLVVNPKEILDIFFEKQAILIGSFSVCLFLETDVRTSAVANRQELTFLANRV